MDIAELGRRTGLPTRRLRYVLDHRVLPGMKLWGEGRGVPRFFASFESFGIALAAVLLKSGLRRSLVEACLVVAARYTKTMKIQERPLFQAFIARAGWLEVGDGQYLRLHGKGKGGGISHDFDTGWQPLQRNQSEPKAFEPLILVRINLTALARRVDN
jgi:hypothetical protein